MVLQEWLDSVLNHLLKNTVPYILGGTFSPDRIRLSLCTWSLELTDIEPDIDVANQRLHDKRVPLRLTSGRVGTVRAAFRLSLSAPIPFFLLQFRR